MTSPAEAAPPRPAAAADAMAVIRSRNFVRLLVLAAGLGLAVSVLAYWFLKLIAEVQDWTFTDLPKGLGFDSEPTWWPVAPLLIAGVLVGATIRYLPGRGGESPVNGFRPGRGPSQPVELPGIALAGLASIALGTVVGPEAPLVALGGGLAYLAVWLAKRDVPARVGAVIAAAGSFAAISTLLGSPLASAFLLMEAAGLGGATATLVLLPGLLGAGLGALIFTGLDAWTGFGTFSLTIPNLPPAGRPTLAEFAWSIAIGVAAALLCLGLRRLALAMRPWVEERLLLAAPVVGLAVAGLAILYAEVTGKGTEDVLFSGQSGLNPLVANSGAYSVGALLLLLACKGLAYAGSMSAFRGGPTFPALYLGAAGGIALSHLPGLSLVPAIAIGMATMITGILRLPMTAVLLTTLLLGANGITVTPIVIVAVVIAYVLTIWLSPTPAEVPEPREEPAGSAAAAPVRAR
jgi:H+/Cl- antiporter ClcA